ncbi:hypothetical protein CPC08DRAFT_536487 [Agrocybe pediades]|nr:hypothetical protein CPC08DRAFT_536487 [Agrocybe pediades]
MQYHAMPCHSSIWTLLIHSSLHAQFSLSFVNRFSRPSAYTFYLLRLTSLALALALAKPPHIFFVYILSFFLSSFLRSRIGLFTASTFSALVHAYVPSVFVFFLLFALPFGSSGFDSRLSPLQV